MGELSARCWVDPITKINVVTLQGATREEADQIFSEIQQRFADYLFYEDGRRTLWLKSIDVFIHHYARSGGELDLLSPTLSCEQLLKLLPEKIQDDVRS